MRVRALTIPNQNYSGYHGLKRRKAGEEFSLSPITILRNGKKIIISPESQFSEKWMEKVDKDAPVKKPEQQTSDSDEIAGDEVI